MTDPNVPDKLSGVIHDNAVCNSVELSSGETWPLDPGSTLVAQWTHTDVEKQGGGPIPVGGFWPTGHGGTLLRKGVDFGLTT